MSNTYLLPRVDLFQQEIPEDTGMNPIILRCQSCLAPNKQRGADRIVACSACGIEDSQGDFFLVLVKAKQGVYQHQLCGRLLCDQVCSCAADKELLLLRERTEGTDCIRILDEKEDLRRSYDHLLERLSQTRKELNDNLERQYELKNDLDNARRRVTYLEDRFFTKLSAWWKSKPW